MPPRINVTVLVWFKNEQGEERMQQKDTKLFSTDDFQWIAKQYAEVNNGLCNIMTDSKMLATFDARK